MDIEQEIRDYEALNAQTALDLNKAQQERSKQTESQSPVSSVETTQLNDSQKGAMHNSWLIFSVQFFIFFALASSFLGIALSLFDFLADGFQIKKTKTIEFT